MGYLKLSQFRNSPRGLTSMGRGCVRLMSERLFKDLALNLYKKLFYMLIFKC